MRRVINFGTVNRRTLRFDGDHVCSHCLPILHRLFSERERLALLRARDRTLLPTSQGEGDDTDADEHEETTHESQHYDAGICGGGRGK